MNVRYHIFLKPDIRSFGIFRFRLAFFRKREHIPPQQIQQSDNFQIITGFPALFPFTDLIQIFQNQGRFPAGSIQIQIFQLSVIQHRLYIFSVQGFVCGQKRGMEKNTDKGAVMLTDGISVMQLPGIYHNPVVFLQKHIVSVNIVIHFPFQNTYELHILMPVTQSLFPRIKR